MSYQALYRKYRPDTFKDIYGQEAIIKILINSLIANKISHAYLFSGPRGTGKTSIAKILAKSINCEKIKKGIACGKCKSCINISAGSPDIIELDAASNNGIDEIREIKNNVLLVPTELKYKVYIIDEVHMLSTGAFNALLKTLEEPPKHVIFILATTDLHKVPTTIISRCQCFDFKRIDDNSIIKRLKFICDKEKIEVDKSILEKIARISKGGLRDSISLLDKVSSYSKEKITEDEFNKIIGSTSTIFIEKFALSMIDSNIKELIKMINDLADSGADYVIFVDDLIDYYRKYVLDYYLKGDKNIDINKYLKMIKKLSLLLVDMKKVNNIKVMFESGIILLLNEEEKDIEQEAVAEKKNISQVKNISREINEVNKNVVSKQKTEDKPIILQNNMENDSFLEKYNNLKEIIINNCFCDASKENLLNFKNEFYKINDYILVEDYSKVVNYLKDIDVKVVGSSEIVLSCLRDSIYNEGIKNINSIEKLLNKIYNIDYKIALVTEEEWNVIRSNFVKNKKSGNGYKRIDYPENKEIIDEQKINDNTLVEDAIAIFGEDIVKIS